MPITRSTWVDDDGSGTTGTIINNAELQKIYQNIDTYVQGSWNSKSFSADDFFAPAGTTWTLTAGNVTRDAWTIIGKTVWFELIITGTTIGGTLPPMVSRKAYPGGSIAAISSGAIIHNNPGTAGMFVTATAAGGQINFFRDWAGTGWAVGSCGFRAQGFYTIL